MLNLRGAGLLKWRLVSGMFSDERIPTQIKWKILQGSDRLTITYEA